MGDYFPAWIEIGGEVTEAALEKIYELARNEGAGFEYGDHSPGDDFQDFKASLVEGEPLTLRHDQASGGGFLDIEEFCEQQGITYVRHSDSHYEINSAYVWFCRGMKEAKICSSDDDCSVLLDLCDVKKCLTGKDEKEMVERLRAFIKENTPCDVPPLVVRCDV